MWISWCHWQNYLSYYRPSRVWQVSYHIHLAALSPSYWTYYVDKNDVTCVRYVRYETNVRTEARTSIRNWGVELAAFGLWITKCDSFWLYWLLKRFSYRYFFLERFFYKTTLCVRTKSMESFHRSVEDLAHNLRYVRYPRKNTTNENS